MHTSIKRWWLLALCGVLDAMVAGDLLFALSPDRPLILRTFFMHGRSAVPEIGMLVLAAGVCTVAAGIWSFRKGNTWLVMLNGLACSALGLLISLGATRPVAFRTIALFIVAMALTMGAYEMVTARALRGHFAEEWLLGVAGAVSVGFALVFLGFALRWIKLEPSPSAQTFHWLGSYFGFSAICMLGLALRQLRPPEALPHMAGRAMSAG